MINEEKLKKLKSIYQLVDEGISKKEFETAFASLIDFIKNAKKDLTAIIVKILNSAVSEMKAEYEALKKDTEADLSDLTAKYDKSIGQALKEQENGLNFIRDKARKIKEGKDGKDADETTIVLKASKMAQDALKPLIPTIEAIEADLPKLGGSIASALELLPDGDKLKLDAVEGLKDILEELRQLRGKSLGGGGFSSIAFQQKFIFKETPTGTVNGVNTDFVLNHTPSPANSLTVYRGGAVQTLTEDFTFSGKTIIFLIAPVAGEIIRCDYLI